MRNRRCVRRGKEACTSRASAMAPAYLSRKVAKKWCVLRLVYFLGVVLVRDALGETRFRFLSSSFLRVFPSSRPRHPLCFFFFSPARVLWVRKNVETQIHTPPARC